VFGVRGFPGWERADTSHRKHVLAAVQGKGFVIDIGTYRSRTRSSINNSPLPIGCQWRGELATDSLEQQQPCDVLW
jgi:hypothetical protein